MVNDTKYQAGKPAGKSTWTKIDPQNFVMDNLRMDNLLVAKEITRICKRFTADVAFIRHIYFSRISVK
jgi:hypothetical protein